MHVLVVFRGVLANLHFAETSASDFAILEAPTRVTNGLLAAAS
jgi:hypothetical protein